MHHVVYISRAVGEVDAANLVTLLVQARRYNEQAGITGALVYGNRQYMQVVEGEKEVVLALYARIVQDPRHRTIFKLVDKEVKERSFRDWSMAFRELSVGEFDDLVGYLTPALFERLIIDTNPADRMLLERMRELLQLEAC